ncbi:MAG: F0F1 ATP synthase subunit beta, partial [Proteobacteria bacterium]|nr:F0F1 ATP synthase subunit beta [Pseudomonadota bacterium]
MLLDSNVANTARRGRIVAIRGPVIDAHFPEGTLPPVNDALGIELPSGRVIGEVQSH